MDSEAAELFEDAEGLHMKALAEMERGELRKAAENAWCASLRATDALILARTGEKPIRSEITTYKLHYLAIEDAKIDKLLVGRYHTRSDFLHGRCFYMGVCPPEPVKRRIVETEKYIEDAKKLVKHWRG